MAGLKDEGGRTGDGEDFSSLTPTRLDLCSYRQTHYRILICKDCIIKYMQISELLTHMFLGL